MGKIHSKNIDIRLNGHDVSNYLNSIDMGKNQNNADVTGFKMDYNKFLSGQRKVDITADGFYAIGDENYITAILDDLPNNAAICVYFEGVGYGKAGLLSTLLKTAYNVTSSIDSAVITNFAGIGNSLENMKVVFPDSAYIDGSIVNGAPVDLVTGCSSFKAVANIEKASVGDAEIEFEILTSADNITYTTVDTITVTGTTTCFILPIALPLLRYVKVIVDSTEADTFNLSIIKL